MFGVIAWTWLQHFGEKQIRKVKYQIMLIAWMLIFPTSIIWLNTNNEEYDSMSVMLLPYFSSAGAVCYICELYVDAKVGKLNLVAIIHHTLYISCIFVYVPFYL